MKLLLKCSQIDETKSFYQELLGFDVFDSAEETCTVENEDGLIIFSEGENLGKHPKCSGTIYFDISDVDGYYNKIKDKVFFILLI